MPGAPASWLRGAVGGDVGVKRLPAHGLPDAAYIAGDTPVFERIALHQGRFNRAILYRSNTLHCAHLPDTLSFDPDPETGRLTVNSFLELRD